MSNVQVKETQKITLKNRFLNKILISVSLLLSTISATAETLICPQADAFFHTSHSHFFSSTGWSWDVHPNSRFSTSVKSPEGIASDSSFLATFPLKVTVNRVSDGDYGHRWDEVYCDYNNGMVKVYYFNGNQYIVSNSGIQAIKSSWAFAGRVNLQTHGSSESYSCTTTVGEAGKCSIDVG